MAAEITNRLDEGAWSALTWTEGTKKPLTGVFYRERVHVISNDHNQRVDDETGWLLLQHGHGPDDDERKAWICRGFDDASLADLVNWAHLRWRIEQFHKQVKQLLGADEF